MPQSVRVEFVKLGEGGGSPENVIRSVIGESVTLSVTSTATEAAARPKVPSTKEFGETARVIALDGPVYAAWGGDPTATLTNSLMLVQGVPEAIFLPEGHMLSFIAEFD